MEKVIIDQGNFKATIRVCNVGDQRWFCLSDICKCIGVKKEASSNYAKRIESSEKTKIKKYIFTSPKATRNLILNCKTPQGKDIKEFLSEYIKNNSNSTVDTEDSEDEKDTNTNIVSDISIEEMDDIIKSKRKYTSPVHMENLNLCEDKSKDKTQEPKEMAIVPTDTFSRYMTMHPDTAKVYYESEKLKHEVEKLRLENERLKIEYRRESEDKDRLLKEKQLETQRQKYICENNKSILDEWRQLNKAVLKWGDISPMEKDRILRNQRYLEDYLTSKFEINGKRDCVPEPYEYQRTHPYNPSDSYRNW